MLWRCYNEGSLVEFEGAAVWSWFSTGNLGTLFQTTKTLIKPTATFRAALGTATGIDDGQYLKGLLSVFEPNILDPKNPLTWLLDYPIAIVIILVMVQTFIYMNLAFVIIGALGVAVGGFAELLGELGTFLSSFI
jgi:hypothetical protein